MGFGVPHLSDFFSGVWPWEPQHLHLPCLQDVTSPSDSALSGVTLSPCLPCLNRCLGGQAHLAGGGAQKPQHILPEVWAGRGLTLRIDVGTTHLASPGTVLVFTYCPSIIIHSALFHSQCSDLGNKQYDPTVDPPSSACHWPGTEHTNPGEHSAWGR